ncbi:DUF4232 domain-containing protein [Streptacidiphilus sp. PAMC 29251]
MNARRSIPLALLATATALLATACASGATTATPGATASTGAAATPTGAAAQPAGSRSSAPAPTTEPTSTKPTSTEPTSTKPTTRATGTGGNANSDAYAWKHPCDPGQVSIQVQYQHSIGDTRRVIVATNHGSAACGLSYYPTVAVADSTSVGPTSHPTRFVTPKVPGGLGGAPYASIHAGQSLYAVIDLDPGHTKVGAVRTYDELDVKAADFLPEAATTNHPVKAQPAGRGNPYVKAPILSLYQRSVGDAVSQVGDLSDFR